MNTRLVYSVKRRSVFTFHDQTLREVFTAKEYENPVSYENNCRYKNVRTLRDEDTNKLYHEIINTPEIVQSENDDYYTVTLDEENRLDIISNAYYGTPKYWWVIADANYIIDPFDVPVGTSLRIPPILSLYKSGGILYG